MQHFQRGRLQLVPRKALRLHQNRKIMITEYHPLAREAMHKAQYSRRIRAAIDQIADKPQLIAIAITRLV